MISRFAVRSSIAVVLCAFGVLVSPSVSSALTVAHGTNPATTLAIDDNFDPVSASSAASPAYVTYTITFSTQATSTLTHASIKDVLPAGTTFASVSSTVGSCSAPPPGSGGTVTCPLGSVPSGAPNIVVTLTISTPGSGSAFSNTAQVSYDERSSDNPQVKPNDPKQDTVLVTETTSLIGEAGSAASTVPPKKTVEISTDPTHKNVASSTAPNDEIADVTVPPQSFGTTARLDHTTNASCPPNQTCNGGVWLQATIPGTFSPLLQLLFRFDSSILTKSGQNPKNFQLFYTQCLDDISSCDLHIVTACSSANPTPLEMPCFSAPVAKLQDGDYLAHVVSDHNGWYKP
jgi:uncharacterized repeat protein (TIGR01451 family)